MVWKQRQIHTFFIHQKDLETLLFVDFVVLIGKTEYTIEDFITFLNQWNKEQISQTEPKNCFLSLKDEDKHNIYKDAIEWYSGWLKSHFSSLKTKV